MIRVRDRASGHGTDNNAIRPQCVLDGAAFSQKLRIPDDLDAALATPQPIFNQGLKIGRSAWCDRALADDDVLAAQVRNKRGHRAMQLRQII